MRVIIPVLFTLGLVAGIAASMYRAKPDTAAAVGTLQPATALAVGEASAEDLSSLSDDEYPTTALYLRHVAGSGSGRLLQQSVASDQAAVNLTLIASVAGEQRFQYTFPTPFATFQENPPQAKAG